MKKKGFTLIELLAVIIILGIILLIAIPNVLKIINQSRLDAFEREKNLLITATRNFVVKYPELVTWTGSTAEVYLLDLQNAKLVDNPLPDPRGGNFDNSKPGGTKVILSKDATTNTIIYTVYVPDDTDTTPLLADNSGANAPVLLSNMIPIMWNGTTWVKADVNNYVGTNSWYDYDTKKWANAVTVTDATRTSYLDAAVGTEVLIGDITTFFVWIPRYKYLVPAGTGEREITITFESVTTPKSVGDGITTPLTHPAFTFGTTELAGIWVGKFETTGTITGITIKPNVTSLRSQTVSTMFNYTRTMQDTGNTYGFPTTGMDIHMMKNMEWGSVVYLSHSKYGMNAEVWINPNSTYITGCAGTSVLAASTTACEQYTSTNGQNASTTGNIFGIYDMSGGAWEYVMGNYNNTLGVAGFATLPDPKYYDLYTTTTGLKGDATNADGTSGWYGDYEELVYTAIPWATRGGPQNFGASSGIFTYFGSTGDLGGGYSYRIVIAPSI